MMRLIALTILIALAAGMTYAQNRTCGPHDSVVQQLADQYGEVRVAVGLAPQGQMVELFASDDTGTWTIIVTNGHKLACYLASGQAFERVPYVAHEQGNDL